MAFMSYLITEFYWQVDLRDRPALEKIFESTRYIYSIFTDSWFSFLEIFHFHIFLFSVWEIMHLLSTNTFLVAHVY